MVSEAAARSSLFSVNSKGFFIQGRRSFPGSSAGQESACNSEDTGVIPQSRRSPGEEIGYLLQYSWASLVSLLVKDSPTMLET